MTGLNNSNESKEVGKVTPFLGWKIPVFSLGFMVKEEQ